MRSARTFESAPGRGNFVARIKGNGTQRPILLMAHLDTVGVEPKLWTVDPFAGLIKDGPGVLRVDGHESFGDYVEHVEMKTGKTVAHTAVMKN